jgi:cytochrome P450
MNDEGAAGATLTSYERAKLETREVATFTDARFVFRSKQFETCRPQDGYGADVMARSHGDSVIFTWGDDHLERRRLEAELFRKEHLYRLEQQHLRPGLERALQELARSGRDPDGRVRVNLDHFLVDVIVDAMAAVIGFDGIAGDPRGRDRFKELFADIDAAAHVKYNLDGVEETIEAGVRAQQHLRDEFFDPSWRRRERLVDAVDSGSIDLRELPVDLITIMIRHRDHYARWPEGVELRETVLYIAGSIHSTATGICVTVSGTEDWIARHPEDAHKRADETFLRCCIQESLRFMHAPYLTRLALQDVTLPSGMEVKQGEVVRVAVPAAERERLGDEEVNPQREPSPGVQPFGLAFGDGRHTCMGKRFVLGDGSTGEGAPEGAIMTALRALYAAGMRLERPPRTDPNLYLPHFTDMPVVFEEL